LLDLDDIAEVADVDDFSSRMICIAVSGSVQVGVRHEREKRARLIATEAGAGSGPWCL
jgi:hypothetical protein